MFPEFNISGNTPLSCPGIPTVKILDGGSGAKTIQKLKKHLDGIGKMIKKGNTINVFPSCKNSRRVRT